VLHYTRLERLDMNNYFSLLGLFVIYEQNEVLNTTPGAVLTTLDFLCYLQMGLVSQSVTLHLTEKTCQAYICKVMKKIKCGI
jgi:hypothetical protein